MKTILFLSKLALFIFIIGKNLSYAQTSISVAGKTFVDKPIDPSEFEHNCEGCGNAGEISFTEHGTATFIGRHDDIISIVDYFQEGDKIIITGDVELVFVLSKDGKEIIEEQYKMIFRDVIYPWEEK